MNYKKETGRLVSLYLAEIFQKKNILIFSISLVLMLICDILLSKPFISTAAYVSAAEDFHLYYLEEGLFVNQLFNTILLSCLILSLSVLSAPFDMFFVPVTGKTRIAAAKVIVLFLLIFGLTLLESLMLYGVAVFRFPYLKLSANDLLGPVRIGLSLLFEVMLGMTISQASGVIAVPFAYGFSVLIFKIICNDYPDFAHLLTYVIPHLYIDEKTLVLSSNNPVVSVLWIILFAILYVFVYNIRELREK